MVDGEGIVVGVDMQQVADEGVVGQGDEHEEGEVHEQEGVVVVDVEAEHDLSSQNVKQGNVEARTSFGG